MKRPSLVCYSSSDEDEREDEASATVVEQEPPAKRRKLPPLSETIAPSPPPDNPALHQGRIRTTPHVDGQFTAHIYVSLTLRSGSPPGKLIKRVFDDSKNLVPTLHEFAPKDEGSRELHVSLSRPVFLRAHQREGLKLAIRNIAREHSPFAISFAAFSVLINDEKTRAFLTMEIGAGHHELRTLSDAFAPALKAIRQKTYYDNPKFHASIAWALLNPPLATLTSTSTSSPQKEKEILSPEGEDGVVKTPDDENDDFPKIDKIPDELLPFLNDKYRSSLASSTSGCFEVGEICVKIGKEVSTFRLNGR